MAITLVKEDGTGLTAANVYADLTDLTTCAELLGEDLSSYGDEPKKSALYVAANKYIDRLHDFKGDPVQLTQGMKAYTDMVTFDDAGSDFIQANVEAAILHLKGYLFVDASEQSAEGEILSLSSSVDGAVSESVTYAEGTSRSFKYNTTSIDALLSKYTSASSFGGMDIKSV